MKQKDKAFETLKGNIVKPIINSKKHEEEFIQMKKIKYSLITRGEKR